MQGSLESDCPGPQDQPSRWMRNSNKYFQLEGDRSKLACTVAYSATDLQVWHQVSGRFSAERSC